MGDQQRMQLIHQPIQVLPEAPILLNPVFIIHQDRLLFTEITQAIEWQTIGIIRYTTVARIIYCGILYLRTTGLTGMILSGQNQNLN
jgi:hypothetical protein